MAKFKPYKVKEAQLQSIPIKEGQLIIVTDTKKIYLDESNTVRTCILDEIDIPDGQKVVVSNTEPQGLKAGDIWMITEE